MAVDKINAENKFVCINARAYAKRRTDMSRFSTRKPNEWQSKALATMESLGAKNEKNMFAVVLFPNPVIWVEMISSLHMRDPTDIAKFQKWIENDFDAKDREKLMVALNRIIESRFANRKKTLPTQPSSPPVVTPPVTPPVPVVKLGVHLLSSETINLIKTSTDGKLVYSTIASELKLPSTQGLFRAVLTVCHPDTNQAPYKPLATEITQRLLNMRPENQ